MHAAFSSVNCGLNVKPSAEKKSFDFCRSRTAMLTKSLRFRSEVGVVADHHARCFFVGELRIEREAERGKEILRLLQVADGDVDEELAIHCAPPIGRSARSRWSRSQSPSHSSAATYVGKRM